MKKLIVTLLLTGIFGFTIAQKRYTISPSHVFYGKAEFGCTTNFEIFQVNTSNEKVIINWKLVSDDFVKGWDYSACAYKKCYVGIPDTLCTMPPILPNEEGFLALNVDPLKIKGTGTVKLYLYDVNAPSLGDTIAFVITADVLNGIPNYTSANALKFYPNPATESIIIKIDVPGPSNGSIQIMDVLGKSVYNSPVSSNELSIVHVKSFSKGIYFVRYDDGNGTCVTKKLQIIN